MVDDSLNWETDPRPFGDKLIDWQKRHGWSRRQVAMELRVSKGMIDQWCSGRSSSRAETICRLMVEIDHRDNLNTILKAKLKKAIDDALS